MTSQNHRIEIADSYVSEPINQSTNGLLAIDTLYFCPKCHELSTHIIKKIDVIFAEAMDINGNKTLNEQEYRRAPNGAICVRCAQILKHSPEMYKVSVIKYADNKYISGADVHAIDNREND